MKIDIDFSEFEELARQINEVTDIVQRGETDKKIINKSLDISLPFVKGKMPQSTDVSKSGRRGSRTGEHAKDNIPVSKIKVKDGYSYAILGWEKEDNSPYFYVKFLEWGTSKIKPYAMFESTTKQLDKEYSKIAEEEYQKLLNIIGR